ncbi:MULTISPECIES: hypothetical protein [unclassified Mycobacterium]|uniref:hypothetical protein n=1 Tax=unclassified Mycobacterium TaxID=2642494 RepID=UPI000A88FD64|nr:MULTISPECIES: hypothetical protein [unclassified Mycobacterium]
MDVAGLSHERGARSSATRRSAGTRDRRGRRAHPAAVRAESARPGQETSRPAPAAGALAAPGTADELQADYFVRLLAGRRGLIDQRIDEYQRKIGTAEARGDLDAVANYRRLARIAEQDRRTLDALIDKLQRRFVRRTAGAAAPQARPVARRSAPGLR